MVDQLHRVKRARSFNDALRHEMPHGSVRISHEVGQRYSNDELRTITRLIQAYDAFGPNEDPDELHDTGIIEFEGVQLVWQIEAWDAVADKTAQKLMLRISVEQEP